MFPFLFDTLSQKAKCIYGIDFGNVRIDVW